jgi:methylated-DNA-[protein]-cysteine S-methyltransferase
MKSKTGSRLSRLIVAYLPQTPFGQIGLAATEGGLAFLEMQTNPERFETKLKEQGFLPDAKDLHLLDEAIEQLKAYFQGTCTAFDVTIDWQRFTPFQEVVLRQTLAIPYGEVKTYAQIACAIGKPRAARAVGQVESHNPIPIIIPCHRVIGSDGSLHGYGAAGGLHTKARLLELERVKI